MKTKRTTPAMTLVHLLFLVAAVGWILRSQPTNADTTSLSIAGNSANFSSTTAYAGIIESTNATTGGFKFPDLTTQNSSIAAAPSGLITFFTGSACPTGWSAYTAASGRAVVGLPSTGTLAQTVATALVGSDTETHSHSFTPSGSVSSTYTGTATSLASGGASHTHTYSVASSTSTTTGVASATTNYPATGAHTHTISGTVNASATYAHQHTFTPAGTISSTFTGTAGTTTTQVTSTAAPYIMLLVCKKD